MVNPHYFPRKWLILLSKTGTTHRGIANCFSYTQHGFTHNIESRLSQLTLFDSFDHLLSRSHQIINIITTYIGRIPGGHLIV